MNDADLQEFDVVRRVAQGVADAVEEERGTPTAIENSMYAYAAVYNIAVRGLDRDPDGLYATQRHLYDAFQDLLSELVTRRPLDLGAPREELFLAVVRKWRHFKLLERWMLVAFKYISTHYVPHYSRRPLDFVALSIFYQCVFQPAAAAVTDVMLEYVAAERQGDTTRRTTMREAVGMLAHMGFDDRMPPDFVQALLVATTEHYRAASADLIERKVDSVEYCQACHAWLRAERELASWLLPDAKMQQELLAVAEHELLAQHNAYILENPNGGNFVALLAAAGKTPTPELTCMVELMVRPAAASVDLMSSLLSTVCRADGEAINARFAARDAEVDARGFVQAFTELHDRYVALGATVLTHAQFTRAIKSAFERTVNAGVSCTIRGATRVVPGPELIAQCCDVLLRTATLSDDELDAQFNAIVSLFVRVSDKDGFLEVMHVCLSRRLLSGGEGDLEREKALIGKLKEHGGASATSKMESMLRDVEIAKALDLEYDTSTQRASLPQPTLEIDFSVLLVRTGVWPKLRTDPLRLPLAVAGHAVAFEMMYLAKENHARREIDWSHNYGHAVLTTSFTPARYELRMTAPQAVVVLCFNARTTWRTVEIARECEMTEDETRRAVHPFLKLRLLGRAPGAGPSEEELTLNPNFTAPTRKVRVPIAMPRLVAPDAGGAAAAAAAAAGSTDARKRPVIEACIMRVMKARQTLEHHALMDTVREHLSRRFEPDPRMMKTVLDVLIDRDFLRRDDASPNVYHFVA